MSGFQAVGILTLSLKPNQHYPVVDLVMTETGVSSHDLASQAGRIVEIIARTVTLTSRSQTYPVTTLTVSGCGCYFLPRIAHMQNC